MRSMVGICLLNIFVTQVAIAEEGFVSLFDGKSLDGWVQHGGEAKYTIEGDEILAEAKKLGIVAKKISFKELTEEDLQEGITNGEKEIIEK